ncbi:hypothetical protein [Photobacterium phosphoreum]|nr:hypothetical protein [Photobacterium phosphoreum]MCD9482051.1 hypothetical protein [Photobacterium phosphoreum]MCD9502349.1 hypothetical protein [Photobacterium phosphoreum]MCD9518208.1 hypothetical protein [Photobacterium phosphoreum]
MNNALFSRQNTTMLTFFKHQLLVAKTNDEYDAIIAMIQLCNWDPKYFQQDKDYAIDY